MSPKKLFHQKTFSNTKPISSKKWQKKKNTTKKLNVKNLKNSTFDKTQKLKMWQNTKTTNVTKLIMGQNSECDKTQKLKTWQLKNPNHDKIQNLEILPNSNIKNVTYLKNSKCVITQTLKMWQNSKSPIVENKIKNK